MNNRRETSNSEKSKVLSSEYVLLAATLLFNSVLRTSNPELLSLFPVNPDRIIQWRRVA